MQDLKEISEDSSFDPKHVQQKKAHELRNCIGNPRFLLYSYFFTDVSESYETWSLTSQKANQILIDQLRHKNALIAKLELLKSQNGDHVSEFLKNVVCKSQGGSIYAQHSVNGLCSENEIYDSEVTYWGHKMLQTAADGFDGDEEISDIKCPALTEMKLEDFREELLELLQHELEKYFPAESLEAWNKLSPSNFPSNLLEEPNYAVAEVTYLGGKLGFTGPVLEQLLEGWRHLVFLLGQSCHRQFREEKPGNFYTWILQTMGEELEQEVGTPILKFLRNILVIPASSSAAERYAESFILLQ